MQTVSVCFVQVQEVCGQEWPGSSSDPSDSLVSLTCNYLSFAHCELGLEYNTVSTYKSALKLPVKNTCGVDLADHIARLLGLLLPLSFLLCSTLLSLCHNDVVDVGLASCPDQGNTPWHHAFHS